MVTLSHTYLKHCIPCLNLWNAVDEQYKGRTVLPEEMLTKKQYYYLLRNILIMRRSIRNFNFIVYAAPY